MAKVIISGNKGFNNTVTIEFQDLNEYIKDYDTYNDYYIKMLSKLDELNPRVESAPKGATSGYTKKPANNYSAGTQDGTCPVCNHGTLTKKTGQYGDYWDCTNKCARADIKKAKLIQGGTFQITTPVQNFQQPEQTQQNSLPPLPDKPFQ